LYKKKLFILIVLFYCIKSFGYAHCPAQAVNEQDFMIDYEHRYWYWFHKPWEVYWLLWRFPRYPQWEINPTSDMAKQGWKVTSVTYPSSYDPNAIHEPADLGDFPGDARLDVQVRPPKSVTCTYNFYDGTKVVVSNTSNEVRITDTTFQAWFHILNVEGASNIGYCGPIRADNADQNCQWNWKALA
jgi:hypothetical protein